MVLWIPYWWDSGSQEQDNYQIPNSKKTLLIYEGFFPKGRVHKKVWSLPNQGGALRIRKKLFFGLKKDKNGLKWGGLGKIPFFFTYFCIRPSSSIIWRQQCSQRNVPYAGAYPRPSKDVLVPTLIIGLLQTSNPPSVISIHCMHCVWLFVRCWIEYSSRQGPN